jgi:hypothetical protein
MDQAQIDELKSHGYSDSDIQDIMSAKQQENQPQQPYMAQPPTAGTLQKQVNPVNLQEPTYGVNRDEEHKAVLQGLGYEVAKNGLEGYAGYKAAKGLINQFKNGPVAPAEQMAQPAQQAMNGQQVVNGAPVNTGARVQPNLNVQAGGAGAPEVQPISKQPSVIEQGMQYAKQHMARANQIGDIAMQKVMQNANLLNNIGKAGVGLAAATYSPSLNSNEQQQLAMRRQMPPSITQPVNPNQPY